VTSLATHGPTKSDPPARLDALQAPRALRGIRRIVGTFLTLLLLACTLLPAFDVASASPRAAEVEAVLALSTLPIAPDTGTNVSTLAVDTDDAPAWADLPRPAVLLARNAAAPIAPRFIGGVATPAGSPPERPPRPAAIA
jgi:hypothetical protein